MEIQDQITHLYAASLATNARAQAFQEALEKILPSTLDGVSSREWINTSYLEKLRKVLTSIEDKNPELAAELQRIVTEVYKIDP